MVLLRAAQIVPHHNTASIVASHCKVQKFNSEKIDKCHKQLGIVKIFATYLPLL